MNTNSNFIHAGLLRQFLATVGAVAIFAGISAPAASAGYLNIFVTSTSVSVSTDLPVPSFNGDFAITDGSFYYPGAGYGGTPGTRQAVTIQGPVNYGRWSLGTLPLGGLDGYAFLNWYVPGVGYDTVGITGDASGPFISFDIGNGFKDFGTDSAQNPGFPSRCLIGGVHDDCPVLANGQGFYTTYFVNDLHGAVTVTLTDVSQTPEPASGLIGACGLAALAAFRVRMRRSAPQK